MLPKRIVFIGSSSIQGRGDVELGGFVNRFKLWHEGQNPKHFVYELGVFGESTASLVSRVGAEAALRKPHLIALYPGFNDLCRVGGPSSPPVSSPEDFESHINALITKAQAIAPTVLMTGFPFDESRTSPYGTSNAYFLREDADSYTQILRHVCKEKDTPLLDYLQLWAEEALESLLSEDGLHANAAGHQLLFSQFRDFFLSLHQ